MNGSGCKNCPVEKCETLNYRGSVCAAQRAKLGLGDPNDRLDCWQFKDCNFRNDVGWCPENCNQYRHKDDVRVIRCEKCRYHFTVDGEDICRRPGLNGEMIVTPDGFCAWGESRNGSI